MKYDVMMISIIILTVGNEVKAEYINYGAVRGGNSSNVYFYELGRGEEKHIYRDDGRNVTGFRAKNRKISAECAAVDITSTGEGTGFNLYMRWKNYTCIDTKEKGYIDVSVYYKDQRISWGEAEDGFFYVRVEDTPKPTVTSTPTFPTPTPPEVSFIDYEGGSRSVKGVAADGAAKVVVKITKLQDGTTKEKITLQLAESDGSLEDDAKIANKVYTRTLKAPEFFVRKDHSSKDRSEGSRKIDLTITVDKQNLDIPEFTMSCEYGCEGHTLISDYIVDDRLISGTPCLIDSVLKDG